MRFFSDTPAYQWAFLLLFASEFTFYLLILQTGVVEYHHSDMHQIWMVPVGGILGIIISVFVHKDRQWLIPVILMAQLILSFDYAGAGPIELFLFGLISGLSAPMLIARIDRFWMVILALTLSYSYGTYYFDVAAADRTGISLFLSLIAFVSSLFAQMRRTQNHTTQITLFGAGTIFLWLLLDAALFETLSRDEMMRIWGEGEFTYNIIIFHIIGLMTAYKARDWKYTEEALLGLFALTYFVYSIGWQWGLSLVYPFVISYYNVIILKELIRLPYALLAVMALSLWMASGMGLMVALSGSFLLGWLALGMLGLVYIYRRLDLPMMRMAEEIFARLQRYLQHMGELK